MTTSAANSVPFSNKILLSVKLLMTLSVFNLILPSAINLLVPVSIGLMNQKHSSAKDKDDKPR